MLTEQEIRRDLACVLQVLEQDIKPTKKNQSAFAYLTGRKLAYMEILEIPYSGHQLAWEWKHQ